jgi:hypothetical protein
MPFWRIEMLKKMIPEEFLGAMGIDLAWSRSEFPKEICTIESQTESGVFDSDSYFLCLLINVRSKFVSTAEVRSLRPYVYYDTETSNVYYGWADSCGNVYDHQDHDIHNDPERVVAWRGL